MRNTSFVDFEKEYMPCSRFKRLNLASQLSILFEWSSNVDDPVDPFRPHFYTHLPYITELVIVLSITNTVRWTLSNTQLTLSLRHYHYSKQ